MVSHEFVDRKGGKDDSGYIAVSTCSTWRQAVTLTRLHGMNTFSPLVSNNRGRLKNMNAGISEVNDGSVTLLE